MKYGVRRVDTFKRYHIPPPAEPAKRNLELIKLKMLQAHKANKRRELDAQGIDVFFISFFLVGMATVDIYNCPEVEGGRITFRRTKLEGQIEESKASISIMVEPELLPYLEKYKGKDGFAFNFRQKYKNFKDFNKYTDEGLNRVGEELKFKLPTKLSSYYSRHSWGSVAGNNVGLSDAEIGKCFNHSDPATKVTRGYIAKDWTFMDVANRAVLDLLAKTQLPEEQKSDLQ